jgi:hypothetical protein
MRDATTYTLRTNQTMMTTTRMVPIIPLPMYMRTSLDRKIHH